jgi:mannose-1-phosphate guanylyltransferase
VISETRPWGHFERFILNEKCTVKLIYVNKNERLSLQYHNKRDEFWKVVKGPVEVQIGDDKNNSNNQEDKKRITPSSSGSILTTKILQTGDTIRIPAKTMHRLVGMEGNDTAIILEISTGEFDEEDIVRLQDDYNRQ